ncbi:MAG: hypothetical protein MUF07_03570, partial [Steroidobacteraceae bacterium]|nr:hypothetical protein [Steroidobacteraceae bacterium]
MYAGSIPTLASTPVALPSGVWDRTAGSLDPCYFWPVLTEGSTMSMFGKILGKLGFPTRDSGRTP